MPNVPPPGPPAGLYAIRHGESVANVHHARAARVPGVTPPLPGTDAGVPLTERGAAQAAALGRWLAGLAPGTAPGLVLCSPYVRALRTWELMAAEAARRGAAPPAPLVDERLRDREMGVFELHPASAIRDRDPAEAERRARVGEWAWRPPGGESLADVALRVRSLLADLAAPAAGRWVLVVAHDAIVECLRYALGGLGAPVPEGAGPVPNASVTRWTGDGTRLVLTGFGETAHLAD